MAKKALIGIAAAAAVVIGVFVTTGWPPDFSGTEGAIGAAKRHQAQQMTPEDVKLGDTKTQEFLQSDVVARLMADRSARAALADVEVREALRMRRSAPGVRERRGAPGVLENARRRAGILTERRGSPGVRQRRIEKAHRRFSVRFARRSPTPRSGGVRKRAELKSCLGSSGACGTRARSHAARRFAQAVDTAALQQAFENEAFATRFETAAFLNASRRRIPAGVRERRRAAGIRSVAGLKHARTPRFRNAFRTPRSARHSPAPP